MGISSLFLARQAKARAVLVNTGTHLVAVMTRDPPFPSSHIQAQ